MDKLKMQTANKADENYRKLAELFPNAVTETVDENGEVVRAIDKDVLMQEIAVKVVDGRSGISSHGRTRRSLSCLQTLPFPRHCAPAVKKAWTLTTPKISISRAIIWKC